MPEYQQTQRSKKTNTIFQNQATSVVQTPASNPYSIIQRAKINPRSLTRADIMQLQRTIGNQAVGRLLSSIGSSSTAQQAPVQRQEMPEEEKCPSCMQRQEIPEEEEPLQGKMTETLQRQEIPEEEEPLQGKFESIQRQEIPEEEEPLQGKMIETVQRQEIPEEEEPLQGKIIGTIQRQEIPEEEEPLQGKFENKPEIACPSCFAVPVVQRQEIPEEEEPLQSKMIETIQRQEITEEEEPLQPKRENNTGMPDNLKAGVESLSGIDMSDVRVHYNSDKPAEVGALAYTQGTNIHVAPGQERHLPHEAWHVVQQVQGRVRPTIQMKNVTVNDDKGLEHEADVMGESAFTSGQYAFFRQGMYDSGSRGEQKSIAHELTQMAQQNGGMGRQSPLPRQRAISQQQIQLIANSTNLVYPVVQAKFYVSIGDREDPNFKHTSEGDRSEAAVITKGRNAFKATKKDGDTVTRLTYDQRELKKLQGRVFESDKRPLSKIGKNEELIVDAHGGISLAEHKVGMERIIRYGELRVEDLAELLVNNGLPKKYEGKIYLSGCNTGIGGEKSYAYCLKQELLKKHHVNCTVQGNLAPAFTGDNQERRVENPDEQSQAILQMYRGFTNDLERECRALEITLRALEADSLIDLKLQMEILDKNKEVIQALSTMRELMITLSAADDVNTITFYRISEKNSLAVKANTQDNGALRPALILGCKKAKIDMIKLLARLKKIQKSLEKRVDKNLNDDIKRTLQNIENLKTIIEEINPSIEEYTLI